MSSTAFGSSGACAWRYASDRGPNTWWAAVASPAPRSDRKPFTSSTATCAWASTGIVTGAAVVAVVAGTVVAAAAVVGAGADDAVPKPDCGAAAGGAPSPGSSVVLMIHEAPTITAMDTAATARIRLW